jgi:hypothetical protein
MASPAETSARSHSFRSTGSPSHPSRTQSERLLAHVQDNCQWRRTDQRVARRTRTVKHQYPLGTACSATSNRLLRTRMYGGVGAGPSDGAAYPIRPYHVSTSVTCSTTHSVNGVRSSSPAASRRITDSESSTSAASSNPFITRNVSIAAWPIRLLPSTKG